MLRYLSLKTAVATVLVLKTGLAAAQTPITSANIGSYAPSLTGSGASGNWSIIAADANKLATVPADFSQYGTGLGWLAGLNSVDNTIMKFNSSTVRLFLGMPSGGETLQSITSRDSSTTVMIRTPAVTSASSAGLLNIIGGAAASGSLRGGQIKLYGGSNPNIPGGITFHTGTGGGGAEQPEKMRLSSDGVFNVAGRIQTADCFRVYNSGSSSLKAGINLSNTTLNRGYNFQLTENTNPGLALWGTNAAGAWFERLRVDSEGNVGIGTINPVHKLSVAGAVLARRVKVSQPPSADWPDYVFDSSYTLTSLAEVEKYVQKNKHLPEVPSAAEVERDGLDLGDSQAVLLKKIEELTLYIIDQNKKLEAQELRLKQLEQKTMNNK